MLSDSITLPVDVADTGSTTDQIYTRDIVNSEKGVSVYTGASHSFINEDTILFQRTLPQPAGNYNGTAKSLAKLRESVEVDGADGVATFKQPAILKIETSVPVGITAAKALEIRQRAIALLDHTLFSGVMENGQY